MEKYDFYRTDLLDESEEMVRHRTDSEKKRLKEADGILFGETRLGRVISDFCKCRCGRREKESVRKKGPISR